MCRPTQWFLSHSLEIKLLLSELSDACVHMLNRTWVACYVNVHLSCLFSCWHKQNNPIFCCSLISSIFKKNELRIAVHVRKTLHGRSTRFCCLLAPTWQNKVLWFQGTESVENKFCLFLCQILATLLSQLVSQQIYNTHSLMQERRVKRHVSVAVTWLKVSFKSHTVYGPQFTFT